MLINNVRSAANSLRALAEKLLNESKQEVKDRSSTKKSQNVNKKLYQFDDEQRVQLKLVVPNRELRILCSPQVQGTETKSELVQ